MKKIIKTILKEDKVEYLDYCIGSYFVGISFTKAHEDVLDLLMEVMNENIGLRIYNWLVTAEDEQFEDETCIHLANGDIKKLTDITDEELKMATDIGRHKFIPFQTTHYVIFYLLEAGEEVYDKKRGMLTKEEL